MKTLLLSIYAILACCCETPVHRPQNCHESVFYCRLTVSCDGHQEESSIYECSDDLNQAEQEASARADYLASTCQGSTVGVYCQ
jgi:hypothetical protein